jgi:hypothetical protein
MDRFERKFNRGEEAECWLWHGAKANKYGYFYYKGKVRRATHVALELLANTHVPEGFVAMHTCDTPLCVNPAHLKIGSAKDNMQDCVSKRRHGTVTHPESYKNGRPPVGTGELNGQAKLCEHDVREIRRKYAEGIVQVALAKEYNVTQANISLIVTKQKWRNLV